MQSVDRDRAEEEIDLTAYDLENPRLASARETFYLEWAEQTVRSTAERLNDFLQKLITLIVALTGATLVAAKEKIVNPQWGTAAALLLFVALLCAIAGVWPRRVQLRLNCASQVEATENTASSRKAFWARWALTSVCGAIAAAIVGFMVAM